MAVIADKLTQFDQNEIKRKKKWKNCIRLRKLKQGSLYISNKSVLNDFGVDDWIFMLIWKRNYVDQLRRTS